MTRRLLPYGERAVLVECADLDEALGLLRALEANPLADLEEVVPGARSLLVRTRAPLDERQRRQLVDLPPLAGGAADTEPIRIEVDYFGDDLAEVAERCGMSEADVVEQHTGQTWTVGFCGFAPGFGYLLGEHDRLRVPRRVTPRTAVPAGSVGLADRWSGVYPREGPGGWQLIGVTDQRLWSLDCDQPALLQPGARVRFIRRSGP